MVILKSSLSDIIAGFILLMISILIYLDMFSILRNPIFSGILAFIFLYLAGISLNSSEYPDTIDRLLNLDLNAVIVGESLLVVFILGIAGQSEVTHYFLLPLIPGLLLMAVAISRSILKASDLNVTIERIDLRHCGWRSIGPLFPAALYGPDIPCMESHIPLIYFNSTLYCTVH